MKYFSEDIFTRKNKKSTTRKSGTPEGKMEKNRMNCNKKSVKRFKRNKFKLEALS